MRLFGEIGERDRHAETMEFGKFDPAGEQHLPDLEDPHVEDRDLRMNADMAGLEHHLSNQQGAPPIEDLVGSIGRRQPMKGTRMPRSGMDSFFDSLETGVVDWFRDEAKLDDPRFRHPGRF